MEETVRMRRLPRYVGEDTSPTSRKELMGWYAYGVAAEVFAVCGVGSFLPITLEQLARERGVLRSDRSTPCIAPAAVSGMETRSMPFGMLIRDANGAVNDQCIIHLGRLEVNTASFAMYTFSLGVFVQALTLVSFSSMADYGNNRKRLLLAFGFTGATATMLFLLVVPQFYLLGSLLVVISVTCLGSSFVVLNSFLPLLVSNNGPIDDSHQQAEEPTYIHLESLHTSSINSISMESNDQNAHFPASVKRTSASPELQLSTQISSKGVGIGYAAAVFVQILSIMLLVILSKTSISSLSATLPLRLVLFLVGLWWFCFTIPPKLWLRDRPGPPLSSVLPTQKNSLGTFLTHIKFAWVSLWKTVRVAARLKQVVIFLVAWFLLSDAVATMSGTAILFAKTELKMASTAIALVSITSTLSGIAGAFLWPILSRRLGLKTNQTVLACIILFELIPLYGLAGFIPFVKSWGVGGLQQAWEIYPLAVLFGFVMGGLSSYCRSYFGLLIPPGSEVAFYALYAITDKGSSVIGPSIVGIIVDTTGEIRNGFGFLALVILLPAPFIWLVDAERGRLDGIKMAESLGKSELNNNNASLPLGEGYEEVEGLLSGND